MPPTDLNAKCGRSREPDSSCEPVAPEREGRKSCAPEESAAAGWCELQSLWVCEFLKRLLEDQVLSADQSRLAGLGAVSLGQLLHS